MTFASRIRNLFGSDYRASPENPNVPISSANILNLFGLESITRAGVPVTTEVALGVPAVWAAVNFISSTIASLPLHVYRRKGDERVRVNTGVGSLLHDAVSDEWTSFAWRKYVFEQVLTGGRGVTFIELNKAGKPINLWPLEPSKLTVKRQNGKRLYVYNDGGKKPFTYKSSEVIDLTFMLGPDQLAHRSPILQNADAIGLAVAITKYGSKFFNNGGVPPFMIEGPFKSPAGLQRAADDLAAAVAKASKEDRQALALPQGHTVKPIGTEPEKAQMVEAQRFVIEQIARIFSLPPTFLQDLTHGTFSNTEQQDLQLVKHNLSRWIKQFEQEMNLKLFGRGSNKQYVEFNIDGLLRGDFKTRMEGFATGIQNAVLTPNEARRNENRPDAEGGDEIFMQGAMMPVTKLGKDTETGDSNEA